MQSYVPSGHTSSMSCKLLEIFTFVLCCPVHVVNAWKRVRMLRGLQDSKGNSPLHYAAGYGRAEATQVLLEAGCTAADPNGSGHRPFELVK